TNTEINPHRNEKGGNGKGKLLEIPTRDVSEEAQFLAGMASSSDSDYYYTDDDDDDDDETEEYTDDDEEEDGEEAGEEEDDDDSSEYSFEDEDDDDDDDEEVEDVAEDDENVESEESGIDTADEDEEEEEVPALEHGPQDEISEGTDAPLSGLSTPVDPVCDDQQPPSLPSNPDEDMKEVPLLKGNPNPEAGNPDPAPMVLAPASQLEGTTAVSSLATDLDNVKIESPPSA
ncbi:hypothetical protein GOP47_0030673, partial [Adiantum capillus-veneris]